MKGVRVRYAKYRPSKDKTYYCINDDMQWDATIPVVFAAFATQVPDVQEQIEVDYEITHEGWIERGFPRDGLEDLDTLYSCVKRDTSVDTDNETFFKIDFILRNISDARKIDVVWTIEGVSVHANFENKDEYGFPFKKGEYRSNWAPEIFENIHIDLPRYHYKQLGDLQGLADI